MSRASPALATGSAGPGGSADAIASFRNQANLKSIARSDPGVQAILETSVYATIYHYEPDAGEWVKQKAEGPLFVVRRDRTPEHAIFMLNRQTVKNVTLPLVRGEMKVTAVGGGMLQIARRGESVWFSEGEECVERFRQAILAICGEPSARPATSVGTSTSASASPAPGVMPAEDVARMPSPLVTSASVAETNGGAAGDGFTRLFAGLMPTLPGPAPLHTSNASSQDTTSPTAAPNVRTTQIIHTTTQTTTTTNAPPIADHHTAPEHSPAPSAPSPPASAPFVPPPGQTVDDLLNSILGVSAFSPVPAPSSLTPGPGSTPLAPPHPNSFHNRTQHPPQAFPASPHGVTSQSPPVPAPPVPLDTRPIAVHSASAPADDSAPTAGPIAGAGPGEGASKSSPTSAAPDAIHLGTGSPFPGAASPFPSLSLPIGGPGSGSGPGPGPTPGMSMGVPVPMPDPGVLAREAVADLMARGPDVRAGGKEAFVRTVMGLMMNEPRFVDDLWINYLRLMGGANGGGGAPG